MAGCGEPGTIGNDDSGTRQAPERVVSFGPHITETIFRLGQGHRVVGVTTFCDFPPEVIELPKVGGQMDPDFEKVALLSPDLMILSGVHGRVAAFAADNGIPTVHVDMDSLATIDEGIATIGDALACTEKADVLRKQVKDELAAVQAAVAGSPKVRTLIITGRQLHDMNRLFTVGGSSFVSELVEVAGGENICRDAPLAYTEASKETIVMRAPEAIIEFHAGESLTDEDKAAYTADWQVFSGVPAVENGRIYFITESLTLRPGPRVALTARLLAKALHPQAFSTPECAFEERKRGRFRIRKKENEDVFLGADIPEL